MVLFDFLRLYLISSSLPYPEFGDVVELCRIPGKHLVCPLVVQPDVSCQDLIFLVLNELIVRQFKIIFCWFGCRPDRGESTQYFEVGSIRDGIWCSPRIYSVLFFENKITWISPVFVFLSFLPTVINHHWSGLAWICVHREKDKILSAKVSQNIFLDFYKLRDNFFWSDWPCRRSEWALSPLWWRPRWRRCTLASPPFW